MGQTEYLQLKTGSDHSNDNGLRDEGEGRIHEVAGATGGFRKAWYLNLPSTDEVYSTYSA